MYRRNSIIVWYLRQSRFRGTKKRYKELYVDAV